MTNSISILEVMVSRKKRSKILKQEEALGICLILISWVELITNLNLLTTIKTKMPSNRMQALTCSPLATTITVVMLIHLATLIHLNNSNSNNNSQRIRRDSSLIHMEPVSCSNKCKIINSNMERPWLAAKEAIHFNPTWVEVASSNNKTLDRINSKLASHSKTKVSTNNSVDKTTWWVDRCKQTTIHLEAIRCKATNSKHSNSNSNSIMVVSTTIWTKTMLWEVVALAPIIMIWLRTNNRSQHQQEQLEEHRLSRPHSTCLID